MISHSENSNIQSNDLILQLVVGWKCLSNLLAESFFIVHRCIWIMTYKTNYCSSCDDALWNIHVQDFISLEILCVFSSLCMLLYFYFAEWVAQILLELPLSCQDILCSETNVDQKQCELGDLEIGNCEYDVVNLVSSVCWQKVFPPVICSSSVLSMK